MGLVLMIGLYMFFTPGKEKADVPAVPAVMQNQIVMFGPPVPTAQMLADIAPAAGVEERA